MRHWAHVSDMCPLVQAQHLLCWWPRDMHAPWDSHVLTHVPPPAQGLAPCLRPSRSKGCCQALDQHGDPSPGPAEVLRDLCFSLIWPGFTWDQNLMPACPCLLARVARPLAPVAAPHLSRRTSHR